MQNDTSIASKLKPSEELGISCEVINEDDSQQSETDDEQQAEIREKCETGDWTTCVAKLSILLDELDHLKRFYENFSKDDLPNVRVFVAESVLKAEKVHKLSADFIDTSNKVLQTFRPNETEDKSAESADISNTLVEHDPGNRKKICTSNQRNFLISLGPYRPQLFKFPVNSDISAKKQNSFNPNWYAQYPHLEYSISKDAVFCFVCCLFPEGTGRSHSENAWINEGVRTWHKMKSRGVQKQGKLSQHFSSRSHRVALQDFCNFTSLCKNNQIDVLLNKANRQYLIELEQEKLYNKRTVSILFDIACTLSKQNLPFRGDDDDRGGNFVQIVQLIARHCEPLQIWLDNTKLRPYHVTYMSPGSQNEFITMIAAETREK